MSGLESLVLPLLLFVMDQIELLGQSFALVGVGRVIYIVSFAIYWRLILQKPAFGNEIPLDPSATTAPSSSSITISVPKQRWVRFFGREILIILVASLTTYTAIFILAISLLVSGRMLRCASGTEVKSKILRVMGIFWNPVFVSLAFLGLIATFFGSVPLYGEFAAVVVAILIYLFRYGGLTKIKTVLEYLQWKQQSRWTRTPMWIKTVGAVILIGGPILFGGFLYLNYFPESESYMLPMRDGIRLNTKVFFPPNHDGSPTSVILIRTPYDISGLEPLAVTFCMVQEYILVVQDMRGCFNSEGGPFPVFRSDAEDGYDTCAWIVAQPWSNGRIASWGGSAVGINQIAYHAAGAPGMKAASITVAAGEMYEYGFFIGGCFRQNLSETWIPGVMTHVNSIEEKLVAGLNQTNLMLAHPTKDAFYENLSLTMNQRYEDVNVRAVHIGGFADMFAEGTIQAFLNYNEGGEYAQDHQILVMGPWSHGVGNNKHPSITFPDNARDMSYASTAEAIVFGDALKDQYVNWSTVPRVAYYVMGDPAAPGSTVDFNQWRTSMVWPVPSTMEAWYFHPNGTLSVVAPSGNDRLSYLYDPRNPVRSIGGTELTLSKIGYVDQKEVEANRADILKFTTAPLSAPVEIVGHLTADLYISSNCSDTDFTVKLMDIFPDGKELWAADGILKARYRDGFATASNMTAGQVYELNIDMWSTAYRFTPGHQIRISVSSSLYNKFALNPNTGGPVQNTHISDLIPGNFFIANNSVLCGENGQASCVWFPRTA